MRPSLLFGPDDNFVQMFARLIAMFPVLPVFGPEAQLRPVFSWTMPLPPVAAVLADPGKHGGKTLSLGGPEVITMLELNQRIAEAHLGT